MKQNKITLLDLGGVVFQSTGISNDKIISIIVCLIFIFQSCQKENIPPEIECPDYIELGAFNNFSNVYYVGGTLTEDKFLIFYNEEKGVVGIENYDKSISLKYEYIE